jgi:glycosyltransferase involved in cell wall biosynthesis
MTWALLTGEFPPQYGGVADYTQVLAFALAAAGDDVHVFAPPCADAIAPSAGISVHRLPDHYGSRSRRFLQSALAELPAPRAAVLQYVAQSFGLRGCNVPFARWLRHLRGFPLYAMFHEVSVTVRPDTPLKYRVQALATRVMAASVIRAADALFVSTPAWVPLIRRLAAPSGTIDWTPVPSNIDLTSEPAAVAAVRERFTPANDALIGHFGTYREAFSRNELMRVVPHVLPAGRTMLFMGRGSDGFAESLIAAHPELRGRVHATGGLAPEALAQHLAACDLLIQPFEDGVSARRGSVTSALALGVPVATTSGSSTESVWEESGAVALAPAGASAEFIELVNRIADDPKARSEMGVRSKLLYAQRFAVQNTVTALHRRATTLLRSVV